MIFIGPTLRSGIGQHCSKYCNLFPGSKYYHFGEDIPECDHGLVFLIPTQPTLDLIPYMKSRVKNLSCMTVCETATVHEDYGKICDEFETIFVPSQFCKDVLSKQFPKNNFITIHAHIPAPKKFKPYTFYHIGNIADNRKNFKGILTAFMRVKQDMPNVRLIVKATCNQDVDIPLPGVKVINGLISDDEMEDIHTISDCYVSFSSSEGVGMGAVEAALRNKPVIITNYGGAPEYIETPYTIDCEPGFLEEDDFLFKKGMEWGRPDFDQLVMYMSDAVKRNLKIMDHFHTKRLVSKEFVLQEFVTYMV